MRILLLATTCLCLAACSKVSENATNASSPQGSEAADRAVRAYDVEAPASPPGIVAPGGIAVTAAPGVAFAYHYAFRLPSARIAGAQEAHAQACEKLGIARCRITGMRYQLIGENNVEAMLAFKLDTTIARAFGKYGIGAIEAAQGTLVDAEITGTDAGAAISQLNVQRARAAAEQKRIDAELTKPKLSQEERAELQRQRADSTQTINAANDSTADQRESLADTPMVFDYGSGKAVSRLRRQRAADERGRYRDRFGPGDDRRPAGHPRLVRASWTHRAAWLVCVAPVPAGAGHRRGGDAGRWIKGG